MSVTDMLIQTIEYIKLIRKQNDEWLYCAGYELYKCSTGYFTLTYYENICGKKKEAWRCYFDLNLAPYYHTSMEEIRIAF